MKEEKEIKIQRKPISDWTAWDFIVYFKRVYDMKYENLPPLVIDPANVKEKMCMKRVVQAFRNHDRPKTTVVSFIDWIFDEYMKRTEFTTPLSVGFLFHWVDDFLQTRSEDRKKKKRQPVVLSEETKAWIEEQKRLYKEKHNV